MLKNGRLDLLDRSIKPSFFTSIAEVNGKIEQLSSSHDQPARVKLTAKANGHAPIEISGKLHPFTGDLFADLQVKMSNVNLSRLTPYANKYVGYQISKGKLDIQLHYLVDRGKLTAANRLFLDRFTFGSRVESPDATTLPVKLAVALLRNRQGEIDLNLPVEGDLDDPQFSLGDVIVKVVVNLITKAVTSPFSLLGAAFGGGPSASDQAVGHAAHGRNDDDCLPIGGAVRAEVLVGHNLRHVGKTLSIAHRGAAKLVYDHPALLKRPPVRGHGPGVPAREEGHQPGPGPGRQSGPRRSRCPGNSVPGSL